MKISCVRARQLDEHQVHSWRCLQTGLYDHPFFAPEYTQLVADVRDDVRVAVIEVDQSAGFFPFHLGSRGVGRPVGLRLTDFQGPLVQDIDRIDVGQLLRCCGLRVWHFDHLVPGGYAPEGCLYGQASSPYMDLSGGYRAYCDNRQSAGSSVIRQFERKARKLEREMGPLRFELHSSSPDVFQTLIQWKADYLRQKAAYPLLDMPWVLDLLDRIRQTDTPDFAGRLSALYAGDRLIAVHLGICNRNIFHWWITTYDVNFNKFSPGGILLLQLASAVAAAGIKRLDLGKGGESYKRRLMSGEFMLGEGTLTRSRVQRAVQRAWYQSRSKLRDSALRPVIQKSKRIIRYGLTGGRSSNGSHTDR